MKHLGRAVFLAVPMLWVAAAHVGPLITMIHISLLDTYPGPPGYLPVWTLHAYAAFLDGPGYRASLLRSVGLAAATTCLSLLLSYPLAYHIARRVPATQRGRRILLLVAPFWASEVLRILGLMLLLANRGAINSLLRMMGLPWAPIQMLYGDGAVLAGMIYTVLLTMVLPLYAALNRLPANVLEAASGLGAGAWRRFWHVTLPLTRRGVLSGASLTFLASLGVLAAPALLGGAGTPVFAVTISSLFGAASGRWPAGAAFGCIILLTGTGCAAVLAAGMRRAERPA